MCSFVRMEVLSKKQRNILYVQLFHKNQSVVGAQREWRKLFKCSPRDIPSRKDILRAVENFAETGEITDQRKITVAWSQFGQRKICRQYVHQWIWPPEKPYRSVLKNSVYPRQRYGGLWGTIWNYIHTKFKQVKLYPKSTRKNGWQCAKCFPIRWKMMKIGEKRCDFPWSPNSPDLNPLDFFL